MLWGTENEGRSQRTEPARGHSKFSFPHVDSNDGEDDSNQQDHLPFQSVQALPILHGRIASPAGMSTKIALIYFFGGWKLKSGSWSNLNQFLSSSISSRMISAAIFAANAETLQHTLDRISKYSPDLTIF